MSFIPLSVLNWYPTVNKRDSAQQIKEKFHFSKADENLLDRLNLRIRELDFITAQAGSCLRSCPDELSKKQIRLLNFVKLTRYLQEYGNAASNAISILRATEFSFSQLDLRGTHFPGAKLIGASLDDVDLSKATLDKVDFTRSSLNRTKLEGTKTLYFGQYPILKHRQEVLGATTTQDDRYLVSFDGIALYKWDLNTGSLVFRRKFSENFGGRYQQAFRLLVSKDEKFLFMVYPGGNIEVFNFQNLKKIKLFELGYFQPVVFCDFICDQQFLMLVVHPLTPEDLTQIILWKIDINSAQMPLQEPYQKIEVPDIKLDNVCIAFNNSLMAASDHKAKCIYIFRLPNMEYVKTIPHIELLSSLQFFPNADKLLFSRVNNVFELKIETEEQSKILQESNWESPNLPPERDDPMLHYFNDTVGNLHFLPHRPIFAYSIGSRMIRLWDIENARAVGSLTVEMFAKHRSFVSTRGDFLIREGRVHKGGENLLVTKIADIAAQKQATILPDIVDAVFSADSQFLRVIKADSLIYKFDVRSGRTIETLEFTKLNQDGDPIFNTPQTFKNYYRHLCRFTSDSDFIVLGNSSWEVINKNKTSADFLNLIPTHAGFNYCHLKLSYGAFAVSGNGQHVVFIRNHQIEVWDTASRQQVGVAIPVQDLPPLPFHWMLSRSVFPVAYAVISPGDCLWEFNFETKVCRPLQQFNHVRIMSLLGDANLWILDDRGIIKQWNLSTFQEREYIKIKGEVINFDVSSQRNLLVTCSFSDKHREAQKTFLSLWDTHSRERLSQIEVPAQVSKIRFSPDGTYLVAWKSYENGMYVWEINENTFRLLWRIPQDLSLRGIKVLHPKKLHEANQALISQLR